MIQKGSLPSERVASNFNVFVRTGDLLRSTGQHHIFVSLCGCLSIAHVLGSRQRGCEGGYVRTAGCRENGRRVRCTMGYNSSDYDLRSPRRLGDVITGPAVRAGDTRGLE